MDYFDHPAISNTKLGWFKKSPSHYKYYLTNPPAPKPSFVFGSASHCMLFEPDKFEKRYHTIDESKRPLPDNNMNKKENKDWKNEILQAYSHKTIITLDEYDALMRMMEALHKNIMVKELLPGCEFEKEVYWTDPLFGLSCKKKIDGEASSYRIDYKTADDADPFAWRKKAWSYDYYRQAGFYDMDIPKEFYFIVQEKNPPYEVSVHRCTQDLLDYGKNEANDILKKIKAHTDTDFWPGYETKNYIEKAGMSDREKEIFDFDIPMFVRQSM